MNYCFKHKIFNYKNTIYYISFPIFTHFIQDFIQLKIQAKNLRYEPYDQYTNLYAYIELIHSILNLII